MARFAVLLVLVCLMVYGQGGVFVCPMDPEVRSNSPGICPRCGMALVRGVPEPVQYPMDFAAEPKQIPAGRDIVLRFRVLDPKTLAPVTKFNVVHEKLFHLFVVSADLAYFSHEHPVLGNDGWFALQTRLPRAGTYRLVADFDPAGGAPQLSVKTFSTAGYVASLAASVPALSADVAPKDGANLSVEMRLEPPQPMPGRKTMMFVKIRPADGLEKFIGAWAHLLAVSDDMVDTMHSHPVVADGGAEMQFNLFFPRARTYRLWIQLQRRGVVNTVAFTVPVRAL